MNRTKLKLLPLVVFCSGACAMSLQLVGSRLLAPHFGNSIFIWTSLIGVMLGFMALGNFLGGRLADRITSADLLFWVLTCLSASISLVAMLGVWALGAFTEIPSLRLGMVLGSVMLFAVPCTLFGIVLPASIRLRMQAVADSGANIGSLSAISMTGSIAGTFVTGFWLIALAGSRSLLAWIALLVLLLAVLMGLRWQKGGGAKTGQRGQGDGQIADIPRKLAALGLAALLILGAFLWQPQPESLQEVRLFDSLYAQYFVGERMVSSIGGGIRPVRYLANSPRAMESAIYTDSFEPFFFEYYGFYDLAASIAPEPRTTLMIGGGAFVYPRFFFQDYPQASMDVVEIDPALLREAEENFAFVRPANMNIYLEDGRMFLNRAVSQNRSYGYSDGQVEGHADGQGIRQYDLVILDAFNSANNVPFQLTTRESMQHCADLLSDEGVLVMNMIVSIEGEGSQFLVSQYLTLCEVFTQIEVFAVNDRPVEAGTPRNVAIIATKSNTFDLRKTLADIDPELTSRRLELDTNQGMILTDDFAPVDQMLIGVNR